MFDIFEKVMSMKIWPELGLVPIFTFGMLLRIKINMFSPKKSTLKMDLALGQAHISIAYPPLDPPRF